MTETAQPDSPRTQKVILESAAKQLACRGMKGLTLRQVAKEADLTRGALQYHFGRKRDLVDATYRYVVESGLDRMGVLQEQFGARALSGQMLVDFVYHVILASPQRALEHLAWLEMEWEACLLQELRPYVEHYHEGAVRLWERLLAHFGERAAFWAKALVEFVDAESSLYLASGTNPWVGLVIRDDVVRFLRPLLAEHADQPLSDAPSAWFDPYCAWVAASEQCEDSEEESDLGNQSSTRERIIRAAVQVLCEHGLAALTHRRLAEAAHVSLAATTYFFRDKREIVEETFRAITAETRQNVRAAEALDGQLPLTLRDFVSLVTQHALDATRDAGQRVVVIKRLYLEAIREPQLQPLVLPGRKGDAEVLYSLLRLVPNVRQTLTFHAAYVWSVWIGGAIGYAQGRFGDADALPYVRERLLQFSPCFFGVDSLD